MYITLDYRIISITSNLTIVSISSGNPDVAIFSPVGSPRILDDPVVLAFLWAVADEQNGVVDIVFAVTVVTQVVVHNSWNKEAQIIFRDK